MGSFTGLVTGSLTQQPSATQTRIANGLALQAGLDAAAASGKYVEESDGLTFEYSASRSQEGRNVGLQVPFDLRGFIGSGPAFKGGTRLVQFARNHPVVTFGDVGSSPANLSEGCLYRGFRIGYGVSQQAQEQASTILIGRGFASRYEDLFEDSYMAGAGPYQGMVGLHFYTATGEFSFSNILKNIKIHRAQRNLLRTGAIGTGNSWENVYLGGGTFGSRLALSGAAAHFANNWFSHYTGAIAQLNIEWVEANQFLFLEGVRAGSFDSLRFEGCKLVGQSPTLIYANASAVTVRALALLDLWIGAEAKGTPALISANFNSQVGIEGLDAKWSGTAYSREAVLSVKTRLIDTGIEHNNVQITNAMIYGATDRLDLDPTLPSDKFGALTTIGRYNFRKGQSLTDNSVVTVRDADHTAYGAHQNPTIRYSGPLTADRTVTVSDVMAPAGIAARMARSGNEIVTVMRDETATGAFAVIVRDHAGKELGRLAGAKTDQSFVAGGRPPN